MVNRTKVALGGKEVGIKAYDDMILWWIGREQMRKRVSSSG